MRGGLRHRTKQPLQGGFVGRLAYTICGILSGAFFGICFIAVAFTVMPRDTDPMNAHWFVVVPFIASTIIFGLWGFFDGEGMVSKVSDFWNNLMER